MKHLMSVFMVIIVGSALAGCSKSLSDTYVNKGNDEEYRIAELEETIKRQEGEIKQLQAKIDEQQGKKITQLKPRQAAQDKDGAIAKAIRERLGKTCGDVKVRGELVKVSFCGVMGYVFFLENAEVRARLDLEFFLEKAERTTGTIEYHTPNGQKMFSISGSLSGAETKRYH